MTINELMMTARLYPFSKSNKVVKKSVHKFSCYIYKFCTFCKRKACEIEIS